MAKKAASGAPMWIVTFADLMSLLVCFFVLIISFSVPDIEKLKIAAGSIRDAFGFTREIRVTGVVELEGNPMFKFAEQVQPIQLEDVVGPIPDSGRDLTRMGAYQDAWDDVLAEDEALDQPLLSEEERFEQIEEHLRRDVLQVPELARLAQNLRIEQTPEGLRIQLIDQTGKSMFPLGSARLYEPARQLVRAIADAIRDAPNRVEMVGHTDSVPFRNRDGYDNWSLSLDRADATRRELLSGGLRPGRLVEVTGRADTDPMIADDPFDPRNRRISITLLRQAPSQRPANGRSSDRVPHAGAAAGSRAALNTEPEEPATLYSIAPRL